MDVSFSIFTFLLENSNFVTGGKHHWPFSLTGQSRFLPEQPAARRRLEPPQCRELLFQEAAAALPLNVDLLLTFYYCENLRPEA